MNEIYSSELIPNKEKSAHCSSIIELPNGNLMVSFYAGTAEKHPDSKIYTCIYDKKTKLWEEPLVRINTEGKSDGNAVLFLDRSNRIWLFNNTIHKEWKKPPRTWDWALTDNKYTCSDDLGNTWSEVKDFFPDLIGWNFKNKPIYLQNDTILVPMYDDLEFQSRMAISQDNCKSWFLSDFIETEKPPGTKMGNIQPSIIQKKNGDVIAFLRPKRLKRILISESKDNGQTWTKTRESELKNPNSGIDAVKLSNGNIVIVFNDLTYYLRYKLSIAISNDEGKTWVCKKILEKGRITHEYSYPAIIQDSEGFIHVTYTYKRECIKHVRIKEEWIWS